jgi:PhnB protein
LASHSRLYLRWKKATEKPQIIIKMSEKPFFAPQLVIPHGVTDISFYIDGLGAKELRTFRNDDESVHVSELALNGRYGKSPAALGGSTVSIGIFTGDVDGIMQRAEAAGATITSPAQDYDYDYRQGAFTDPFGHLWLIEKDLRK